jgi:hypothetical protein
LGGKMKSSTLRTFVVGMLALQAAAVALLWLLSAFSVQATAAFAFLLAADVMAFAVVAHVYRTSKDDGTGPEDSATPARA